ncbi:MAG: cell division protein FtsZ [Sulfurimonas sp.]|nr:cell division protein FtsZ [Sulfurimonadaceae bacterium]
MDPFTVEESVQITGARIVAIGVGGGGGNMISHMNKSGIKGIELIMANTDIQALQNVSGVKTIQIGAQLTKGLGCGMKPEIGHESALESYDEIKNALAGADIVFISAGLGGGTGTGAVSVIAKAAKEVGALTISVVTKPFSFEGQKRSKLAKTWLEQLKQESDSIVVIPNDKLLSIIDKKLGIKDSFKIVDSVLSQAVSGTAGVILASGEDDINLDFADFKTVMSHKGLALMGMGEFEGEDAAYEAIKLAIESPLLDNVSIDGAMGVLVHFYTHPSFSLIEISESMNVVRESAHEDADVIFGTTTDPSLPEDYVKITVVATGFEKVVKTTSSSEAVNETKSEAPLRMLRPTLAVGSDLDFDSLDTPTWVRRQKD